MLDTITATVKNWIPYYNLQISQEPIRISYESREGGYFIPTKTRYVKMKVMGLVAQVTAIAFLGALSYAVKREYDLNGRITFSTFCDGSFVTIAAIYLFYVGNFARKHVDTIFEDRIIKA